MRSELPDYDTPQLFAQWNEALAVLTEIGELGVARAMGLSTRRMIFQVLRAMGAKDVLDVGTCFGTSAVCMALAGCQVVSVDIRKVDCAGHGRPRNQKGLMEAAGVADKVEFIIQDAREYMAETDRMFDFISLDGGHGQRGVYEEISLAQKLLRLDGLLFLDDVQIGPQPKEFTPIHGPLMAIQQHLSEGAPLRMIHFGKTMYGEPTGVAFLVAA
jgi:predicted O-methyltransferase YrrM